MHRATIAIALFAAAGSASAQCSSSKQSACSSGDKQAVAATEMSHTVTTASHERAAPDIVEAAMSAGKFGTLLAAAKAAGLVDALKGPGPLTVFAPTDEAFAKLPKGTVETLLKPENKAKLAEILKFHVVAADLSARTVSMSSGAASLSGQRIDFATEGSTVRVNGAAVIMADVECSNGVVHAIDTVIMPESRNLVELGQSAGKFGTLLAAAQAAGLAGTLSNDGPFTLLAPTDEAFAALPPGTVESLLKPENKSKLAAILKYHVIKGRVYAGQAAGAGTAATLNGQSVMFDFAGGQLRVSGANIVKTDLDASNGVVHVIDRVLLPE